MIHVLHPRDMSRRFDPTDAITRTQRPVAKPGKKPEPFERVRQRDWPSTNVYAPVLLERVKQPPLELRGLAEERAAGWPVVSKTTLARGTGETRAEWPIRPQGLIAIRAGVDQPRGMAIASNHKRKPPLSSKADAFDKTMDATLEAVTKAGALGKAANQNPGRHADSPGAGTQARLPFT